MSNYYHIHDTPSEHLDVTVAHPKELTQIADTDKNTEYANEIRGLLSDHGITEDLKPLSVEGRESLAGGHQWPAEALWEPQLPPDSDRTAGSRRPPA